MLIDVTNMEETPQNHEAQLLEQHLHKLAKHHAVKVNQLKQEIKTDKEEIRQWTQRATRLEQSLMERITDNYTPTDTTIDGRQRWCLPLKVNGKDTEYVRVEQTAKNIKAAVTYKKVLEAWNLTTSRKVIAVAAHLVGQDKYWRTDSSINETKVWNTCLTVPKAEPELALLFPTAAGSGGGSTSSVRVVKEGSDDPDLDALKKLRLASRKVPFTLALRVAFLWQLKQLTKAVKRRLCVSKQVMMKSTGKRVPVSNMPHFSTSDAVIVQDAVNQLKQARQQIASTKCRLAEKKSSLAALVEVRDETEEEPANE